MSCATNVATPVSMAPIHTSLVSIACMAVCEIVSIIAPLGWSKTKLESTYKVEEKFPKENFRVNREMRDEILVYESILTKF